jgi:hypothetical protein
MVIIMGDGKQKKKKGKHPRIDRSEQAEKCRKKTVGYGSRFRQKAK